MRLLLFILALFSLSGINAQSHLMDTTHIYLLDTLEFRQHLEVLVSDSLEGRYTGSEGQKKAAKYIVSQFKQAGLIPYNDTTFYQPFSLWSWHWGDISISDRKHQFSNYDDFVYMSYAPIEPSISAPCIFIGSGADSIVNALDLNGKIAIALVDNFSSTYKLSGLAKSRGAIAILFAHNKDKESFLKLSSKFRHIDLRRKIYKTRPTFSAHLTKTFAVSQSFTEQVLGVSFKKLLRLSEPKDFLKLPQPEISLSCPIIEEQIVTENIAGYIKGTSNETIVLSAHYDHIGKRGDAINYGADDNASGTTALITLAKTLNQSHDPYKKNILFLATTGEELGLLGALHFAEHQNELPFDIKANLNIDMIGRRDSTDKSNYIYLIGAREYPVMDSICNAANQLDNLSIDYSYAGSKGFGNFLNLSDHYAFHKQGIPVLGFFSGLHADYHKPTDTVDKIEFGEMLKRVRLIYGTTLLLVDTSAFDNN